MEALIGKLLDYGTTPALLVLTFAVAFLIRKVSSTSKKDGARADALQKLIQTHVDKISEQLREHEKANDDRFKEHAERMAAIERDYLPLETHYKDVGGWRSDLAQLRSDVADELRGIRLEMSTTNTNLIATVLKGGKHGG